jgi:hypothetical protein
MQVDIMPLLLQFLFQLVQRELHTRLIVEVDSVHLVTRNLAQGLLNEFFARAWIVFLVPP